MGLNKGKNIIIGLLIILALTGAFVFYIYQQGVFPVIMVGNNTISSGEWEENLAIAKKFDNNVNRQLIRDKLLERIRAKILAGDLKLSSKDQIDNELSYYKSNQDNYSDFLEQYFNGSEKLLIKYVIEPSVIDAKLRIYFNSKKMDNKALDILDKIKAGEKFEDLAKSESDDKVSAQFGGDLGFFEDGDVLPELADQIKKGPAGEVQKDIFISRYGYHIVYPVETAEKEGKTLWHGKHIMIKSEGYENWFEQMTRDIKVRYLVNLD